MAARAGRSPTSGAYCHQLGGEHDVGWVLKAYRYDVVVTNSCGSATSAVATLTLVYADTAALLKHRPAGSLPVVEHDSAQMVNGGGNPDGELPMDNGNPPGQTYTTGSDPSGYIADLHGGAHRAGSMGGLPAVGQAYVLRVYAVSGGSATLYATPRPRPMSPSSPPTGCAGPASRCHWRPIPPTLTHLLPRLRGHGLGEHGPHQRQPYAGGEVVLIRGRRHDHSAATT